MEKEERTAEAAGYEGEITAENLWSVIVSLQGKVFYTSKKLPFTYTVRGGELFTDRRDRSVTRSRKDLLRPRDQGAEKAQRLRRAVRLGDPENRRRGAVGKRRAEGAGLSRTPFLRLQKEKEDARELLQKQRSV